MIVIACEGCSGARDGLKRVLEAYRNSNEDNIFQGMQYILIQPSNDSDDIDDNNCNNKKDDDNRSNNKKNHHRYNKFLLTFFSTNFAEQQRYINNSLIAVNLLLHYENTHISKPG